MAEPTASALRMIGRKKIARTRALPLNFRFRSMATNRLKKMIIGRSISMSITEEASVCLKVAWLVNASR